jgi:hypothetical protein
MAKLMVLGRDTIKLYADRVESKKHGGGSLREASARIETAGWRGQKTAVVIEGPEVAISARTGNGGIERGRASQFVAQLNSAVARLAEGPR